MRGSSRALRGFVLLGMSVVVTVLGANPATAAPPSPTSPHATDVATVRANQKHELDVLQQKSPSSRRINDLSLEMAPGVIVTSALSTTTPAARYGPPKGCNYKYLCVYSNAQDLAHGGGWYLSFYTCGQEWDLGKLSFPDGGAWNDKISAIFNNQTPGTASIFYNYRGNGSGIWDQEDGVDAGEYILDLSFNGTNDIIDGVHVCGSIPNPWKPNYP